MRAITQQEFAELEKADPYFRGRWPYISVALENARQLRPKTILEIGAKHSLFDRSAILDIKPGVDFVHDASETPWPIESDSYDLVMALQVWEHLGDKQAEAFEEVMRVARAAVLSFPYKWVGHNERHDGIDLERIKKWTCGIPQSDLKLIGAPDRQRIVMLWRFQ